MKPPRPTIAIAIVLSMIFVDALGYGMIVPLLPSLVGEAPLRALAIGGIASTYAALQLIGMPLLGWLSDRIGRRPVLLLSIAGTALAYTIVWAAREWWLLYLAVALDGLTAGSLTAAQSAMADLGGGPDRTRRLGWLSAAHAAGIVGGPLVGGVLGSFGVRVAPLAAAFAAGVNLIFGLAALPETRSFATATPVRAGDATEPETRDRSRARRRLIATAFCVNFAFMALPVNLPIFTSDRFDWGTTQIGLLLALGGASAAVAQLLLLGLVARRLRPRTIVALAMGAMTLTIVAVPFLPVALIPVAIALFAVATALAIPSVGSGVAAHASGGRAGAAIGAMNTAIGASMLGAPIVFGALYEAVGAWAPYVAAAAVSFLGALLAGTSSRVDASNAPAIADPHGFE